MRVLAAVSLGGSGHLEPLVPFLAAARARGDEVLVVGPPGMGDLVGRAGFAFAAGGEPPEAEIAPLRERLPVAPPEEATVLGNRELFGRLAATAMLPALREVCAEWAPDLVLRDPCEYASAVVAPPLGLPVAQVAISLARAEAGSIDAAAPALEEHRPGVVAELRAGPYLTRFPASLDPSPFPATTRYRAPEAEGSTGPRPSLPDWWDGAGGPLVYVTFGTVLAHMSFAADVYRAAVAAAGRLDARVLVTVGRVFDAAALGPLPANVHVEAWVDQAEVVGEADAVVCHGGSGTVLGTLAAGVPLVVVPQFADQFVNGERVVGAGAGVVVTTGGRPGDGRRNPIGVEDAPRLAAAVESVLATPEHRTRARAIAEEMASAPSVAEVLANVGTGRAQSLGRD